MTTSANVDQFSKFFHQLIRKKILYVYITKIFHFESTVERCSVECCCIMVLFSPLLSLHCFLSFYAIFRMLYTYLSKIN